LDGSQHFEADGIEYDAIRTDYFRELGIKVIRFANSACDTNFEGVCKTINIEVRKRLR